MDKEELKKKVNEYLDFECEYYSKPHHIPLLALDCFKIALVIILFNRCHYADAFAAIFAFFIVDFIFAGAFYDD